MNSIGWPLIIILNAVIVVLVGLIVVWKLYKDKKAGYPRGDERTSRLSGKAALGTLWISYIFMISLVVWNVIGTEFLDLPELGSGWTVISIMVVCCISFVFLRWYYERKGDA